MRIRLALVVLAMLALAVPAFAAGNKNYNTTYPVPCPELWGAVKAALGNPDNYKDVQSDEEKMTAEYNVKHSIHWSVVGAINQGKNHVSLLPIGTTSTCQMSVISMYSGLSHNDQGDFKKRVDEALAKLQATKSPEPGSRRRPRSDDRNSRMPRDARVRAGHDSDDGPARSRENLVVLNETFHFD